MRHPRRPRHQRNVVLDPSTEQPKILFILSAPQNSVSSLSGLLEVFLREKGSAVQLACPLGLPSIHAAVEVLLRCHLTRAEDLVVKIYDGSSAIGVVRCQRISGPRERIHKLIHQAYEMLEEILTEVRISALAGLPRIQLQLLDPLAGSGPGA